MGSGGFQETNLSRRGNPGSGIGGGGAGSARTADTNPIGGNSGAGTAGIVIVEEFL